MPLGPRQRERKIAWRLCVSGREANVKDRGPFLWCQKSGSSSDAVFDVGDTSWSVGPGRRGGRTRQRPLRPRRAIVDRITAPALPDLLVFQWTFKMEFFKCNICPFLEIDFESFKALFTANNYHPSTPEGHIRPPGDTFTISDSSSFVLSPGPEIL